MPNPHGFGPDYGIPHGACRCSPEKALSLVLNLHTMYILAVDTASNAGGIALSRNAEVIGLQMAKIPLQYSEKLIGWIDFMLGQHNLCLSDMNCFAVASGPGSFTGLRIGIAAVKAFAQVTSRPVVGMSSLEALAYRFREVSDVVAPVIDARRQQIYGGVYRITSNGPEPLRPETVGRVEDWLRTASVPGGVFVGDGAILYRSAISSALPGSRILETDNCVLRELCQLAYIRIRQGLETSAQELKANYLRPPDVKMGEVRS